MIFSMLGKCGLAADPGFMLSPLAGDGSDRVFCRFVLADGRQAVAVLPSPTNPKALAEARAGIRIGRHLAKRGAPLPEIYGADEENGLIVFEDVGDLHLSEWVKGRGDDDHAVAAMYERVLEALLDMQIEGGRGFQPDWCWDSPCYDRRVMLDRESGYFLEAFARGLLGLAEFPAGLAGELEKIADRAASAPAGFFLHRDFQSRNIMITPAGGIRIIDYQGGRLGPLGYDLASLLLDPYVALPDGMRHRLLLYYLDRLAERQPVDRERFADHYWHLCLQRNMQILGAFAFLSRVRKKPFFAGFIGPALATLSSLLATDRASGLPALVAQVALMKERFKACQTS